MDNGINDRQKQILKAVIDKHTKEKESVSSLSLIKTKELKKWSSATIRNDMVILEQKGYLKKEHFSSGKIPTKLGYQFYIESLMHNIEDNNDIKKKLFKVFSDRCSSIDQVLDKCAVLISNFLNLPLILVRTSKTEKETLKKIDLVSIDSERFLLYLITSTGEIIKDLIVISDSDNQKKEDLVVSIRLLNEKLINQPINQISKFLDLIVESIKRSVLEYEFIYEVLISKIIVSITTPNSFFKTYNTKSLINVEEINALDVLELVEKYSIFETINYSYLKTGKILFNFEEPKGLTVATTDIESSFHIHRLSVIGPTSMNYPLIKNLFDFLNEKLREFKT